MNTTNSTYQEIIDLTIKRVNNKDSQFSSALQKLVNFTEENIKDFLKREIKQQANEGTPCLAENDLIIKALDGSRLICEADETFKIIDKKSFVDLGINKPGVATPETPIQVHSIIDDREYIDVFRTLPGGWNQKWLSQDQVIEFCETISECLVPTFCLIKKDENKPVDEDKPEDNLVVVGMYVDGGGRGIIVNRLGSVIVWFLNYHRRVVVPEFKPLEA